LAYKRATLRGEAEESGYRSAPQTRGHTVTDNCQRAPPKASARAWYRVRFGRAALLKHRKQVYQQRGAYWGDNLDRLVAVKQQYDPENLFHHA
jgi:hypothetical protein